MLCWLFFRRREGAAALHLLCCCGFKEPIKSPHRTVLWYQCLVLEDGQTMVCPSGHTGRVPLEHTDTPALGQTLGNWTLQLLLYIAILLLIKSLLPYWNEPQHAKSHFSSMRLSGLSEYTAYTGAVYRAAKHKSKMYHRIMFWPQFKQ